MCVLLVHRERPPAPFLAMNLDAMAGKGWRRVFRAQLATPLAWRLSSGAGLSRRQPRQPCKTGPRHYDCLLDVPTLEDLVSVLSDPNGTGNSRSPCRLAHGGLARKPSANELISDLLCLGSLHPPSPLFQRDMPTGSLPSGCLCWKAGVPQLPQPLPQPQVDSPPPETSPSHVLLCIPCTVLSQLSATVLSLFQSCATMLSLSFQICKLGIAVFTQRC